MLTSSPRVQSTLLVAKRLVMVTSLEGFGLEYRDPLSRLCGCFTGGLRFGLGRSAALAVFRRPRHRFRFALPLCRLAPFAVVAALPASGSPHYPGHGSAPRS